MFLLSWDKLPPALKCDEVRIYYDILKKKKASIFFKRVADIAAAVVLIALLSFPMLIIALIVKRSSKGSVLFKQERITAYGKSFMILKFRTMHEGAEKMGSAVTAAGDSRVTSAGRVLRKYRLDELPQLFNVISGSMSLVGTRPEVRKFVEKYTDNMKATLLMPAGITSLASITFKDEETLFKPESDIDREYIEEILPQKMLLNLEYLSDFGFFNDLKIILKTVTGILK